MNGNSQNGQNGQNDHFKFLLDKIKTLKSDVKTLKNLYVGRKSDDFEEKKRKWVVEIQNTKKNIEELLKWINEYGQMNIKWDLPMEILEQLDKFDNLEAYIENLRKEVEILYQEQRFQCRNAELFREYLIVNVNK